MQDTITIAINGDACKDRKKEIRHIARSQRMTVSEFILWLIEEYEKRQSRKNVKGAL